MIIKALHIMALTLSAFLLIGCSGDEIIGTGVQGLKLPSSINIATPKTEKTIQSNAQLTALHPAAFNDPGTDYSKNKTSIYFDNELQSVIEVQNSILCLLDKLNLDKMVNQGAYSAILNGISCSSERQSITQSPLLISLTAITERKDNQTPQSFKVWMTYPELEIYENLTIPLVVMIEGSINQNVGVNRPFGDFTMSFKISVDNVIYGGTAGDEIITSLDTVRTVTGDNNEPQVKTISTSNIQSPLWTYQGSASSVISLNPNDDQSGNVVSKSDYLEDDFQHFNQFGGQFDNNTIFQGLDLDNNAIVDSDTKSCYSRNQLESIVQSYWLYHESDGTFHGAAVAAGEQVSLHIFETIVYENFGGTVYADGYAGARIPDGATVSKINGPEKFSFHLSPGLLKKHTSNNILLSKSKNTKLTLVELHPDPRFANYGAAKWKVGIVDNEFKIEGVIVATNTGDTVLTAVDHDNDPSTPELPVAATLTFTDGQTRKFKDINYGNSLITYRYQHNASVIPTQRMISQLKNNISVAPSDPLFSTGPVTLYCYITCPIGGLDQTTADNATTTDELYHNNNAFSAEPYMYTLSNDNHKTVLTDVSNGRIVDTTGLTSTTAIPSSALYEYRSGRLVEQPLNEPVSLLQLYSTTDYFYWLTGNATSNHQVTLVDSSGNEILFDQSLTFMYQHDAANDRDNTDPVLNPNHGKLYTFYAGFSIVDSFFNSVLDENGNMRPPINLLDGTQMFNEEGNFVVKAKWIAQFPQLVALEQCNTLNIDDIFTKPSLTLPTPEDIIPLTIDRSDEPIVNGSPAIIDGVIQ